jgi:NADPH2:quinone reductase
MPIRIVAAAYGGPEVLEQQAFDAPALQPHEVRVKVKASGVNPYDAKSYSGTYDADPTKLPILLGLEASGVVTEVSSSDIHGPCGPINVDDEVIVHRISGAYADEIVAKSASILPKPASITWEEAGSMMAAGTTAAHCITATDVRDGDTVVIHGAAGGVGLFAVQLAIAAGANVIATESSARHDLLRELGATPVVYGDGLAQRVQDAAGASGVDAALDLVGTDEALDVSLQLVEDRARIASIANFARAPKEGVQVLGLGSPHDIAIRDTARLQLLELVNTGKLRLFVDRTFPLTEATEAHKVVLTGHTSGKIVLIP